MKAEEILNFIHELEKLKRELRHSWLSDGRQESVAEHSWRSSLMALLLAPQLENKIDLFKALKMAVIHDISETFVGDMPAFLEARKDHNLLEKESMEKLRERYASEAMNEICQLWQEFEENQTAEAKFVKALDKLEVRIQHNEADINTWNDLEYPRSQYAADKYCQHDQFIKEFNELVKSESKEKITRESERKFEEVLDEASRLEKEK